MSTSQEIWPSLSPSNEYIFIQIINSPFWAAGILTVILLTTGDYKWWLFGLYVLFAFFGKLYIKNNEKGSG